MQPTRRAFLGGGLGLLGLGVAGCTTSPAAPSTAAPTSSGPGRLLVVGAPARALTRDPARALDVESFRLIRQVFETLLGVDPDTGAPTPHLAERHEESDGGRLHTFHLVSGVVFDDGEPCDAAAVVANIERWAAAPAPVDGTVTPPSSFVSAFGGYAGDADSAFAGVEAHGELEVRLRLHSPAATSRPRWPRRPSRSPRRPRGTARSTWTAPRSPPPPAPAPTAGPTPRRPPSSRAPTRVPRARRSWSPAPATAAPIRQRTRWPCRRGVGPPCACGSCGAARRT